MVKFSKEFDYIKIKLASPNRILQWANRKLPNGQFIGEVQKSETINYRTFKPEMDGLFCERIFGPSKSLECACGKYKRVRYEGLICERCGVELTESRVRRHRMGYINLIYPVTHVWYINSRPNYMAILLEVEACEKKLNTTYTPHSEECIECWGLKVTKSTIIELWDERIKRIKLSSLAYFIAEDEISFYGLHWDLQQYRRSRELGFSGYPLKPYPKPQNRRYNTPSYLLKSTPNFLIGAPLIKRELEKLNLNSEIFRTRCFILVCTKVLNKENPLYDDESKWFRKWEQQRIYKIREQAIKRIRILENLVGTGSNPAWMILTVLPVIPPALRPMIQLEGGRFATSDLNELYRRIITRNNRLLRLLEIDAPQLIIRNEKRMLQEAVDTLIDNGKRGKIALSANNRPLKSLSDIIKGKHGRFRQNLLGKRVDYSGRSVIVVGPSLKLNQCGLPYEMAIELFQPFIIRELINQGLASNMKIAKNLIQQNEPIIDPVLEKVLANHPIFLNRAPTLHRLGIQAFEPILVQGRAIKLHPLVCSAFNADFDGDQMAVHIPLSIEAQAECYMLMLAPYNFLSPANGEPIIMPSQDMVLGCYYLTVNNVKGLLGSNHYFADLEDVLLAYNQDQLEIHSSIWLRYSENDSSYETKKTLNLLKTFKLKDQTFIEYYEDRQIRKTKDGDIIVQYLKTTTGRVILNYTIQKTLNFL
uniref:DNA-directed RNA polymerase subunit beta' n=1 Tax=Asterionellopsis glacialis TaxID=33640 RepID=A0A023H9U6_9STRA|nr:RNA polymerase b'-subunit [Asterionellopsis glacialis]AGH28310.1 RNA polymerase b'-subunit [Asterionellopsis glacialis]